MEESPKQTLQTGKNGLQIIETVHDGEHPFTMLLPNGQIVVSETAPIEPTVEELEAIEKEESSEN